MQRQKPSKTASIVQRTVTGKCPAKMSGLRTGKVPVSDAPTLDTLVSSSAKLRIRSFPHPLHHAVMNAILVWSWAAQPRGMGHRRPDRSWKLGESGGLGVDCVSLPNVDYGVAFSAECIVSATSYQILFVELLSTVLHPS